MRSKRVAALFGEYLSSLPVRPKIKDGEPYAIVYGTDEFKIIKSRQAVMLGGVGLLESPGVEGLGFVPEWLAVVSEGTLSRMIFGVGNPFRSDHPSMPKKGGAVIAAPASIGDVPTKIA